MQLVQPVYSVNLVFLLTHTDGSDGFFLNVDYIAILVPLFGGLINANLVVKQLVGSSVLKVLGFVGEHVTVIACDDQAAIGWVDAFKSLAKRSISKVVLQVTVVVADHDLTSICAQMQLASLVENVARNIVGHFCGGLHKFLVIAIFGLELILEHDESIVSVVDFQEFEAARTGNRDNQVCRHVEFRNLEGVAWWRVDNIQINLGKHLENVVLPKDHAIVGLTI